MTWFFEEDVEIFTMHLAFEPFCCAAFEERDSYD
jgi:hypothetical protein